LAIFAFAFSFSSGMFYLRGLHLASVSLPHVWLAWGVLCLSQAFGVWATIWTCLLQGVGYIGWDALAASLVSALTLLAQIIVTIFGGGLVALAVVAASGVLLQRLLIVGFARSRRREIFALKGQWNLQMLQGVPGLAFRAWLTAVGAVL